MPPARRGSAPSGRATLRRVAQGLERGWPPGLTVLTGADLYHLDRAQGLLLESLTEGDPTGFGLTVWGEGKVPVERVVEAARAVGMFSSRRVILVRGPDVLEGEAEPLLVYASKPPAGSFLLVRAPKLDLRRKIQKALLEAGTALVFGPLSPDEVRDETRRMARERSLVLDVEALAFVVDACAGDLYSIGSELDKLRDWLGSSAAREIAAETARTIVTAGGTLTGWEVSNAIEVRDRGAALEAARRLAGTARDPGEVLRILGGLAARARLLLRVRALADGGLGPAAAAARVRGWRDERLAAAAMRYSLGELLGFPSRLLEADRTLKSRSISPVAVLESLLEDLTAPARPGRRPAP